MFRSADTYTNYKESLLLKRPKCSCCKEHIQEEKCIELPGGEVLCEECEKNNAEDLWYEFGREAFVLAVSKLMERE